MEWTRLSVFSDCLKAIRCTAIVGEIRQNYFGVAVVFRIVDQSEFWAYRRWWRRWWYGVERGSSFDTYVNICVMQSESDVNGVRTFRAVYARSHSLALANKRSSVCVASTQTSDCIQWWKHEYAYEANNRRTPSAYRHHQHRTFNIETAIYVIMIQCVKSIHLLTIFSRTWLDHSKFQLPNKTCHYCVCHIIRPALYTRTLEKSHIWIWFKQ